MKRILIISTLFAFSCGSEKTETPQECKSSDEAQPMNLCSFQFPIQETGFMCPQGTPYLHLFEEAAVCSEDPILSEGQHGLIENEGIQECDNSESEFCLPLTASEQREADCDRWALETTCLETSESDALLTACKSAALGASVVDWEKLGACNDQDNNSQLGGGDFCVEISGCLGEELRVCHQYNDECFDIRSGRLATCDILAECSDDSSFRTTCDPYVTNATNEEYEAFKECAEYSNNAPDGSTVCEEKVNCANALIGEG